MRPSADLTCLDYKITQLAIKTLFTKNSRSNLTVEHQDSEAVNQKLIDAAISRVHHLPDSPRMNHPIWIIIPYNDERSTDVVCKQLRNLRRKIDLELQPTFASKKIVDDLWIVDVICVTEE